MNQRFIQFCLVLLIVCWGGPVLAHPHVFIVPAVNFSVDGDRLTSLKIEWTFDEMTTMAALGAAALGETYTIEPAQHASFWGQAIPDPATLTSYCFFDLDGTAATLALPSEISLKVVKGQLIYCYSFHLDQSIRKTAKFWFGDQSNYIAFDTGKGAFSITQSGGATPSYSLSIQPESYIEKITLGI